VFKISSGFQNSGFLNALDKLLQPALLGPLALCSWALSISSNSARTSTLFPPRIATSALSARDLFEWLRSQEGLSGVIIAAIRDTTDAIAPAVAAHLQGNADPECKI
jgi:hypothetical protein